MGTNLDIPRFTISDLARATNVDLGTIKNWLNPLRSILLLGPHDRSAEDTGHVRLFSLRRVYQAAITAHLVGLGIGPREAALVAAHFTDVGSGGHNRKPGELFPDGVTLLVISPGDQGTLSARVMRATPSTSVIGLGHIGVTVINCNPIVSSVRQTLGVFD